MAGSPRVIHWLLRRSVHLEEKSTFYDVGLALNDTHGVIDMAELEKNGPRALPMCVALVDDEVQITQALQTLLTFRRIPTCTYHSAESLLQAIQPHDGQLQLQLADGTLAKLEAVVLDLHLPGMNGVDLLLALRRLQPRLRLVMMTAAVDPSLQAQLAQFEGVTLLTKPFSLESLESALFND